MEEEDDHPSPNAAEEAYFTNKLNNGKDSSVNRPDKVVSKLHQFQSDINSDDISPKKGFLNPIATS